MQYPSSPKCFHLLVRRQTFRIRPRKKQIWWSLHNRTGGRCQSVLWNIEGPAELGTIFHGRLCCIRISLSVRNPYGRNNSTLCISTHLEISCPLMVELYTLRVFPVFTMIILLYILTPQRYIEKYTPDPAMLKRIGIGSVNSYHNIQVCPFQWTLLDIL